MRSGSGQKGVRMGGGGSKKNSIQLDNIWFECENYPYPNSVKLGKTTIQEPP